MGTFSSIQTRVLNRVIDTPAAVQAEVPALVNAATTRAQKKHNFEVMSTEVPFVTNHLAGDGGRFLGTFAPAIKEYRVDPFWIKNDGTVRLLATASKRGDVWGPDYIDNADIGFPLVLVLEPPADSVNTTNVDVYPLPDGNSDYNDGEYRIFVPVWQYLPILVNGTDHNWFTDNMEDYIVFYASGEAFAMDWNEQRANYWFARAKEKYDEALLQDKRKKLAGVTTLVPHRLGARQSKLRL